jgi:hypothetical protein
VPQLPGRGTSLTANHPCHRYDSVHSLSPHLPHFSASQEFHFSSSLTETPCIFCILYLLKECQQQPEVREQLVRRLKEHIPDLDIEFVIPQICQLLLTWPYDDAQSLIAAVTSRAGACMHLAIKIMWWLEVRMSLTLPFLQAAHNNI